MFHDVLNALLHLYTHAVVASKASLPPHIIANPKFYLYFKNCVGALDGSHIHAHIAQNLQPAYRNQKGFISQNVLAVCDLDMNFTYILARWEESTHDGRVLTNAISRGFGAPTSKYYLADAGYNNSPLTMVPYCGVRYHLKEQARRTMRPQTKKELFNLRHASLQNVIERAFGVLKRRFKIIRSAPEYFYETQMALVYALCALNNFIHQESKGVDELEMEVEEQDFLADGTSGVDVERSIVATEIHDNQAMSALREKLATQMWMNYRHYLRQRRL